MTRFNKSAVVKYAQQRIEIIRSQYRFDLNNGTAQLKGKAADVNRAVAYGQLDALRTLLEEIESGCIKE